MLPLILHPPASFLVSQSVRFGETRKDHLWFPEMIHCRTLTEGACNKVSQGYYLYRHLVYQPHTQLGLPLWSSRVLSDPSSSHSEGLMMSFTKTQQSIPMWNPGRNYDWSLRLCRIAFSQRFLSLRVWLESGGGAECGLKYWLRI